MKVKHCIGVLSYCVSDRVPDRFLRLKESLTSMRSLKNNDNYMFLWDNGSSDDVKEYLKTCDFFDDIFFSEKNLMDNAPLTLLNIQAQKRGAEFVSFLCDDSLIYDPKAIPHCFEFLRSHPDCGYVRVLKYEFDRRHIYDKIYKHPEMDVPNAVRHFNTISGQPLVWELTNFSSNYRFFKNNWHWTEFPNVCRADVFDKIIPKDDCGIMSYLEDLMMRNYHNLGLKTGVLDIGAITHNQRDFHSGGSLRVSEICGKEISDMVLKYDDLLEEIEKVCHKNLKVEGGIDSVCV